ncbi:helix-turn-helix domain-containing protein [Fusobacterium necrophorum]|uniref:helix-turn-helix domain-containing protein n=1 Tax=Fusobacterium necrophorum TaxID=859 RepID=UPI001D001BEF|nr:helix-turn-helix domain-containing protein [Fusobacterium necrophorum]
MTKRQKGKHLTLWERGQIEAYSNMGLSKTEIALRIGVSRRTMGFGFIDFRTRYL